MAVFMSGGTPVTWSNSYTTSVDAAGWGIPMTIGTSGIWAIHGGVDMSICVFLRRRRCVHYIADGRSSGRPRDP